MEHKRRFERKKMTVLVSCLAVAILAGVAWLPGAPSIDAWLVDSLVKVFPDDSAGTGAIPTPEVAIPRGGHASIQLAVRSDADIAGLTATAKASGLSVLVRRVGTVPVGSNPKETPAEEVLRRAPGDFPDPLFEDFPVDVPARKTVSLWITLSAPASASPGTKPGEVTIRSSGRTLARLKFSVHVSKAVVPPRQTLKVTNWFQFEESHLEPFYKMGGNRERYWRILENTGRVMADHRQNVLITPVFSLVDTTVNGDQVQYNFAPLDRWVETFERAGLIGTIEGGHLLGRVSGYDTPIVVPAYVVEGGKAVVQRLNPDDPRAPRFFETFLPALHSHLKSRGWLGRYIQHIHDEPHGNETPVYQRYAELIRKNLPGVPTIDAVGLDQDIRFFADVCDVWVPVLGSFNDQFDKIRGHVAKGGQAWFYTCIFPQGRHLNRFIDYSLLKVRLLHWFNYRHDFAGFLHWGGNYWHEKPFENVQPIINDGTTLLPAGDNAIVYPNPAKDSVLSSIRLEAMREGIEDFELLSALAKNERAKADELVRSAIPNIEDYVRDVAVFRKLQRRLYDAF